MRISDWSSDVCSSDLLSVMQCINDAEFALFGHMDIDFRRRNIVREGREELLGRGFLFAEDLQQARGAVDAIVKTEPALLEEDVAAHFAGQQGAALDRKSTRLNSSH